MKRISTLILIATLTIVWSGCSMCCGPYDYDYPTFGGKHQRVNPSYGRVGSIFSDPLAGYSGQGADSNLAPPPELENRELPDEGLEEIDPMGRDRTDVETDDLPQLDLET